MLLKDNELATVLHADLRRPASVLDHQRTRELLDFTEPVALLMCAVLHFIPDEDGPLEIIAAYRETLCPGSFLAISHATDDHYPTETSAAADLYKDTKTPGTLRTYEEIARFFNGFTLVDPGLVYTPLWRPEPGIATADPRQSLCYGGVARLGNPSITDAG
ncbi:SAM-dependent methyltransferase [Actinophytocola sp.]|uniref:SAM-dependent methyltransferase n=1 Tax=Actinophytocola sp. TaxID=1872138 RepID=UPI00389AE093